MYLARRVANWDPEKLRIDRFLMAEVTLRILAYWRDLVEGVVKDAVGRGQQGSASTNKERAEDSRNLEISKYDDGK
jgi:hypothetical protein